VTHNGVILSDQRQRVSAGLSQSLDEISLYRLPERQLVDLSNPGGVFRSLGADDNHATLLLIAPD
jgi:hypothetical protein